MYKKDVVQRLPIVFLLTCLAGSAQSFQADTNEAPWTVRVIVSSEEPICSDAAAVVSLSGRSRESIDRIRIPISAGDLLDRDWKVPHRDEHTYKLRAAVTSCSGLTVNDAEITLRAVSNELRRSVLLAVQYRHGRPRLTYLQANIYIDATSILGVSETPDGVTVTNFSERPISRCQNSFIDRIDREYLIDGRWSGFNRPLAYEWAEDVTSLAPSQSMVLQQPRSRTIGHRPDAAKVRPERKRFVVFTALDAGQFLVVGDNGHAPGGMPGCNVYYVEAPVTDKDFGLEVHTE